MLSEPIRADGVERELEDRNLLVQVLFVQTPKLHVLCWRELTLPEFVAADGSIIGGLHPESVAASSTEAKFGSLDLHATLYALPALSNTPLPTAATTTMGTTHLFLVGEAPKSRKLAWSSAWRWRRQDEMGEMDLATLAVSLDRCRALD